MTLPAEELFECHLCLFLTDDEDGYNGHMLDHQEEDDLEAEAEDEGFMLPGYDARDFTDVRDFD